MTVRIAARGALSMRLRSPSGIHFVLLLLFLCFFFLVITLHLRCVVESNFHAFCSQVHGVTLWVSMAIRTRTSIIGASRALSVGVNRSLAIGCSFCLFDVLMFVN